MTPIIKSESSETKGVADVWKFIAVLLAGGVISGASTFFMIGTNACTRLEAHQISADSCQWLREKGQVTDRIVNSEKKMDQLGVDLRTLTERVGELVTEIRVSRREREMERERDRDHDKDRAKALVKP